MSLPPVVEVDLNQSSAEYVDGEVAVWEFTTTPFVPVKVAAELDKLPFPVRQEHGQLFAQVTPLHARDPHFSMDLFDHGSTRPRVPQPGTL